MLIPKALKPSRFPELCNFLPEFDGLITGLSRDCESGVITSREQLANRVNSFFSSAVIDRTNSVMPGWRAMTQSDGGTTLVHILTALSALPFHERYLEATAEHKSVMTWVVLFHDIAKRSFSEHSDHTHAFRSATQWVQNLPGMGIQLAEPSPNALTDWSSLVQHAVMQVPHQVGLVQDNTKLPEILDGIDYLMEDHPSAALVAKTVLLHHSITVLDDWPQANPLNGDEIRAYINRELLSSLEIMALVDNDGWELFERDNCERYRTMTRKVFLRLQSIIDN